MRIFILLYALSASLLSFSQSPTFTWSSAHTKSSPKIDVKIYPVANGYFIVNKKAASGMEFSPSISVEYFDRAHERAFIKDIAITAQQDFVAAVPFADELSVFTALYNKDAGQNVLTAIAINQDGSMGESKVISKLQAEKLSQRGRFQVTVSPDRSRLFVLSEPEFRKAENEAIFAAVYTKGFAKLWEQQLVYPYAWTKAVNNTPVINNTGTAFIIKKNDVKGSEDSYSVFAIQGKTLKEYPITMDGKKKVATLVHAIAPDGSLVTGGYYNEDGKVRAGMGSALHGIFMQRTNNNGDKTDFNVVIPFEKRKDIIAKDIVFHADKSILLGERYYVSDAAAPRDPSKPATNEQMFARDYTYYGRDIIIDGFDASGKQLYASTVEKDMTSKNDNGSPVSYFAAVVKDKLHIIFNDDKYKYDDKKRILVVGSPKIVVHTTVDPLSGTVAPTLPLQNMGSVGGKAGDMLLRPDAFAKQDDNHFLIRADNSTIYRVGAATF